MSADPISTIRVRKRDGSLAPYDGNEVAASIMDSARGLDDAVARQPCCRQRWRSPFLTG